MVRYAIFSVALALGIASSPACGDRKAKSGGGGSGRSGGASMGTASEAPRSDPALLAELRLGARPTPVPARTAPTDVPLPYRPAAAKGSYRAIRPVAVFRKPSTKSQIRGGIAKFTRLPRVARVEGEGCPRGFLYLAEQAYVCLTNLKPDRRPPKAKRQPPLGANRLTPGTYGYIRTGGTKLYWTLKEGFADRNGKPIKQSDTVRWAGKRFYQGMKFWRITTGYFIRGNRVRRFWPSRMKGVDLIRSKRRLPLVFMVGVRRRHIGEKLPPIDVHAAPADKVVSGLKRYTAWPTDAVVVKGEDRWYRIPGKGWVSSEMVRLARLTDPPAGLHPDARWIDVDLEEQTLVAYHGRVPVYATLVAAGVWKYPTPRGTFRIYKKMAEADMKSEAKASEQYRVDHVPWTMYFKRGYALHGAYWHNGFGHARSHGCINLAPADAKVIYELTSPVLPDGWTSIVADKAYPGTTVRIRGKPGKPKPPPPRRSPPRAAPPQK